MNMILIQSNESISGNFLFLHPFKVISASLVGADFCVINLNSKKC